ncbi:hypothetical protein [Roseomonas sp. WA12]
MLKPMITAFALLAVPALAQNAPTAMKPTRDVAVTYRLSGAMPGAPAGAAAAQQEMRMQWSVSTGKQRVDPPGGQGWVLIDQNAASAVMVMDAQRMVMTLPAEAAAMMTQGVPPGARFTRKATAQVAGQSCTEWDLTIPQGSSTICMTDDGVMLRAVTSMANGNSSRLEATEVRYGTQDAARFQVPQGYQTMAMPTAPAAPAR